MLQLIFYSTASCIHVSQPGVEYVNLGGWGLLSYFTSAARHKRNQGSWRYGPDLSKDFVILPLRQILRQILTFKSRRPPTICRPSYKCCKYFVQSGKNTKKNLPYKKIEGPKSVAGPGFFVIRPFTKILQIKEEGLVIQHK